MTSPSTPSRPMVTSSPTCPNSTTRVLPLRRQRRRRPGRPRDRSRLLLRASPLPLSCLKALLVVARRKRIGHASPAIPVTETQEPGSMVLIDCGSAEGYIERSSPSTPVNCAEELGATHVGWVRGPPVAGARTSRLHVLVLAQAMPLKPHLSTKSKRRFERVCQSNQAKAAVVRRILTLRRSIRPVLRQIREPTGLNRSFHPPSAPSSAQPSSDRPLRARPDAPHSPSHSTIASRCTPGKEQRRRRHTAPHAARLHA